MQEKLVSVIIPVYNGEKYLEEAVRSILGQDYSNLEVILVNDCSTDGTLDILRKFEQDDKRIRLIDNPENQGRSVSRNNALDCAKGDFIAILDADDVALPNRISAQVQYLTNHPEITLTGSSAIRINEQGEHVGHHKAIPDPNELKQKLLSRNCIYHSTITFRKNHLRYRDKFNLAEDYDFYLQFLAEGYQLANLEEELVKYRVHAESATGEHAVRIHLFAEMARNLYWGKIRNESPTYASFDPNTIYSMDIEQLDSKSVLEVRMESCFKKGNYRELRKIGWKYVQKYGIGNYYVLMCLLSLGGSGLVNLVRRGVKKQF